MVLKMVHFVGQTLYCLAIEMVPLNLGAVHGRPPVDRHILGEGQCFRAQPLTVTFSFSDWKTSEAQLSFMFFRYLVRKGKIDAA